ncbi:MAG: OmpA family protein [Bryobacterales bacterium]|nr:OmpA family protein [Bryobacterales bacterium]
MSKKYIVLSLLALALLLFVAGCKKKIPAPAPLPPPPTETKAPAAPTIATFVGEPSSIDRGQSSTLRWVVEGADEVSINNGIGTVMASGTRQVFPTNTTTYVLTARNAGGSVTRSVTVNVNVPPAPVAAKPTAAPTASLEQRVSQLVDAYFDYDKFNIRSDAASDLTRDADALKTIFREFPSASLILGGYCDPRGSAEYNMGLGDRRSRSAMEFLSNLGVDTGKLRPVSYGEEVQTCSEATEDCYQRNRRVHFATGN